MKLEIEQYFTAEDLLRYWNTTTTDAERKEFTPVRVAVMDRFGRLFSELKEVPYDQRVDILATLVGIEIVLRRKKAKSKEAVA